MTSHTAPSTSFSTTEPFTTKLSTTDVEPLLKIMETLRDPQTGCPWDKAQTFQTIVPFTLEEAYEVADTIERLAWDELPDELGDLLFQIVFYCQLGKEQGLFDFATVIEKISDKLTRRHPHVFGDKNLQIGDSAQTMKANWEAIKVLEREQKALQTVGKTQVDTLVSALDNIPRSQPALSRAIKIQQRVARVGFDWAELEPVVAKIHEEIDEVLHEVNQPEQDQAKVQSEMGDLLFAVVNLARHLKVDPEQALRQANLKFERRFRGVEQLASDSGKSMQEHTLVELDTYWDQVKATEPR
ncbi:nucleoside triphosphate pyrophosphohydrolase [Shewanella morhuae]|uniref:Nucleoside triphosphate pyrophosphohydrolase n=1 Tax=Shewanella morhuae TaxID=365591 RepID=A0A380A9H2_9GAMM|nr:nucleoside triphosphate pyrophosphohydrolase [Shewanella morhuae]SUI76694.1 Nucleoside triphosphate pyrophosphohydrolase [Shewanella morhuae]